MIEVPHARCNGFGWVYVWVWSNLTHVPQRRKHHCGPCRRTGYIQKKPVAQPPLPNSTHVVNALRKRRCWLVGDELVVVHLISDGEHQGKRLGLYRLNVLTAVVRETRVGSIYLDAPKSGYVYRRNDEDDT